jgi:hypothetical protein
MIMGNPSKILESGKDFYLEKFDRKRLGNYFPRILGTVSAWGPCFRIQT